MNPPMRSLSSATLSLSLSLSHSHTCEFGFVDGGLPEVIRTFKMGKHAEPRGNLPSWSCIIWFECTAWVARGLGKSTIPATPMIAKLAKDIMKNGTAVVAYKTVEDVEAG